MHAHEEHGKKRHDTQPDPDLDHHPDREMQERHALAQVRRALLDAPPHICPKSSVSERGERASSAGRGASRAPGRDGSGGVLLDALHGGVFERQEQQRGKDVARDAHHAKDPSPPEAIDEQAPDEVRGGHAGGEAELLDGHGAGALTRTVHDGDERLRRGGAPRLAQADAHAKDAQLEGVLGEPAEGREGGPHDETPRQEVLPTAHIRYAREGDGGERVDEHERRAVEHARARVRHVKLGAHFRQQDRRDVPVRGLQRRDEEEEEEDVSSVPHVRVARRKLRLLTPRQQRPGLPGRRHRRPARESVESWVLKFREPRPRAPKLRIDATNKSLGQQPAPRSNCLQTVGVSKGNIRLGENFGCSQDLGFVVISADGRAAGDATPAAD